MPTLLVLMLRVLTLDEKLYINSFNAHFVMFIFIIIYYIINGSPEKQKLYMYKHIQRDLF